MQSRKHCDIEENVCEDVANSKTGTPVTPFAGHLTKMV